MVNPENSTNHRGKSDRSAAPMRVGLCLAASFALLTVAARSRAQLPAGKPAVAATEAASASVVTLAIPDAPTREGAPAAESPRLHHAPVSVAAPHEALTIHAIIDHPQLVRHALVVYVAAGATVEVPFLRGEGDDYVATIPASDVRSPSLGYAIELELADGARIAAFASRAQPFVVDVPENLDDVREAALLERLGGRRSVFSSTVDYISFGTSTTRGTATTTPGTVLDSFVRAEASYTYRPLRTVVEFSIRTGIVRGQSPVPNPQDPRDFKVGLNYAAPTVLLRLTDAFHLEVELLTSVTEVGFSSGVGGALHVGDVYGSKLVVGFETVKTFGTRGYARLDIARDRFRVSPLIEVTDMPHADRAGVRLITELAFRLGDGWSLAVRGGYQARDFKTGGPAFGTSLGYAF